jgi:crotonobetainyl-CoA:carnitine CoA-transferase CaiB-like acyl-CoA transferase
MGFPLYYSLGGASPRRYGASHASIAPYGPFAAGDGGVVILGVQNEDEWRRFCEIVLQRPDLLGDERFAGNAQRVRYRSAMQEIIEGIFVRLTRGEILSRLEQAGIANAEMRTMESFFDHPQLVARERWREVSSPAGVLPALLPPVTMSGVEPVFKPIPALGEHTDAILSELGYESTDIAQLRADQVS